jgi:hypothetical protein
MTELADDLDVPAEIRRELMDAAVAKQISTRGSVACIARASSPGVP